MAKAPEVAAFKKLSRGLVIALALVVALAGFNVSIPGGRSSGTNWRFVFTHPTILLHVIVAIIVLVVAAIALIMTVRGRDRTWVILSIIGLIFVVLAFVSGVEYVDTLHKSALNYMSFGWLGAVVIYGVSWYLGHRKERQKKSALSPGS